MMNQRKLVFSILGLIVVTVFYYVISGYIETTEQITKSKQKVNAQLTEIEANGFSISDRGIQKENEHFVIRLDDPQKASVFLTQKGIQVQLEEAEELKGLQLGIDLTYINDTIALELYPVVLPTNLKTVLMQEKDQNILVHIEEMLKRKVFLMHVEIDHSATTFIGYIKDISETIAGEKEVKMTLQGFHFSATMKEEKIIKLTQTINTMHLYISDMIDRSVSDLQKNYVFTGPTAYDYSTDYSIEKIKIDEMPDGKLLANNIAFHSTSSVKNGLAVENLHAEIENIDVFFEKEKFGMQSLLLTMNINNLDVDTFEKLQKVDSNNTKTFDALVEKLLLNNIHIEVPMLSVDKITLQGKEINGFSLHSKMDIDKSLDFYRYSINPKYALGKINAKIELSLSKELLTVLKEDPKAMLMYMMYRPKRVEDKRIYNLDLKDGLLNINGKDLKINGKTIKF